MSKMTTIRAGRIPARRGKPVGNIPDHARDGIRRSSKAVQALEKKLEEEQEYVNWVQNQLADNPEPSVEPADLETAKYSVEQAARAVEDEIDFEYRASIVESLQVPEGWAQDKYADTFSVSGPWGTAYFDVESSAGATLAAYLGVNPATLRNHRERVSADSPFASRANLQSQVNETTWAKTGDWIAEVLWEQRRRVDRARDEFTRRQKSGPRRAATWSPPEINFHSTTFIPHLAMLDNAPPCARCNQLVVPMDPDKGYVYCKHCAQGYAMQVEKDGTNVELRALHYDCPGCGALEGLDQVSRPSACTLCGVVPLVSTRYGTATYMDPKMEKKDSGTGLFADKKRAAQLAKWRAQRGERVAEALDGLEERYARWEEDLRWKLERLPVEQPLACSMYAKELSALKRFPFTMPDPETRQQKTSEHRRQRFEDLEKEITAAYPFGLTLSAAHEYKKKHPWAHDLIERLM